MSAAPRLPAILASITASVAGVALLLTPRQNLPVALSSRLPANLRAPLLKLLGLVLLLLNLKNVPTTWHFRVLRAIYYQIYTSPTSMTGKDLFRPLVTTTWNSPLDCDYNLHKSNSTYFADLDVARAHFVGALLRTSLRRLNRGDREGLPEQGRKVLEEIERREKDGDQEKEVAAVGKGKKGAKVPDFYIIALGGVACVFRKEIKPLERFEIWTRVLSWDGKWIYIVSHIVKAGAVKPKGYHLQPWRLEGKSRWGWQLFGGGRSASSAAQQPQSSGPEELRNTIAQEADALEADLKRAVFATSVAKYVCKKGRLTIAPELVLQRSYLLPSAPKPSHMPDLIGKLTDSAPKNETVDGSNGSGSGSSVNGSSDNDVTAQSEADLVNISAQPLTNGESHDSTGTGTPTSTNLTSPEAAGAALASVTGAGSAASASEKDMSTLTWDEIETMRVRGLKYAEMFDGLTGLHDEFGKDGTDVLGVYGDWVY